jgi:hypothetical protein
MPKGTASWVDSAQLKKNYSFRIFIILVSLILLLKSSVAKINFYVTPIKRFLDFNLIIVT